MQIDSHEKLVRSESRRLKQSIFACMIFLHYPICACPIVFKPQKCFKENYEEYHNEDREEIAIRKIYILIDRHIYDNNVLLTRVNNKS